MIILLLNGEVAYTASMKQLALFCDCGFDTPAIASRWRPYYFGAYRSKARFSGMREQILARDRHLCQACRETGLLVVHHRRPGTNEPELLVTLCAACHARLHRLATIRVWIPEPLVPLWAEQHPGIPIQVQLAIR